MPNDPKRWGYSKLKAYGECPYSALLSTVHDGGTEATRRGTILHLLVQREMGCHPISDTEVAAYLALLAPEDGAEIAARVARRIKDALPGVAQWRSEVQLYGEVPGRNDRWIGGFADLVGYAPPSAVGGTFDALVDLKMGEAEVSIVEVTHQLGLYRDMLVGDDYGRSAGRQMRAYLVTLDDMTEITLEDPGVYLARARARVAAIDDFSPRPGGSCLTCLHRSVCQYAKLEASEDDAREYVRLKLEAKAIDDRIGELGQALLSKLRAEERDPRAKAPRLGDVAIQYRTHRKVPAAAWLKQAYAALIPPEEIATTVSVKSSALEMAEQNGIALEPEISVSSFLVVKPTKKKEDEP